MLVADYINAGLQKQLYACPAWLLKSFTWRLTIVVIIIIIIIMIIIRPVDFRSAVTKFHGVSVVHGCSGHPLL